MGEQVVFFNKTTPLLVLMINYLITCVGKSYLIHVMSLFAEHSLRSAGQDPDCPSVILCAATGKCADLIGKSIEMRISW